MVKPKINLAPEVKININKFLGAVELKVTDFTNIASNNVPELRSSSIRSGHALLGLPVAQSGSFIHTQKQMRKNFTQHYMEQEDEGDFLWNLHRPTFTEALTDFANLDTVLNPANDFLLDDTVIFQLEVITNRPLSAYLDPQATEATITCKISGFAHIVEQYVVNRRGWKLDIDNHRSNSRFLLSSTVGIGEFVWRMALFIRNDTLIVKILCECPQNNTELHMLKGCEANVEATIHSSKNDKVDRGNGSYIWSFYRDDGWDFYYYDFDSTTCTTASCEELSDPENGFVQNDSLQITASISDVREPEESMGSIDSFGIDYWTNA
ncbi:hypothetical protein DdX_08138 [Ditylenchus destructor]|uniref:MATH domain-containing protein n=1 Tax=Ditylenchus destructor TaxID=166010 RepID=A0AAD4N6R8_9BILA|nr:hypothetical protein DdX_08138 [Ditylenchus destructor]